MLKRKVIIAAIFLLGMLVIGAASAADIADADNSTDVIGQDSDSVISSTDGLEVGEKDVISTPNTFMDLDDLINREYKDNDTIQLSENYTFNSTTDSGYENGISINRAVTIYGNGITLDGANSARIFKVTGDNVVFQNITFVNGYAGYSEGGAIYSNEFTNVINCTFINNYAFTGGAMIGGSAVNCSFISNRASMAGAIVEGSAINCSFIGNCAYGDGGAMIAGSAVNCSFIGNHANVRAGAMYGGSATNPTFILNYAGVEGWDYVSTSISGAVTSISSATIVVSDFVSAYNSGEKLFFDVVHDNEILKGVYINITIKNATFTTSFPVLSGQAVPIDLAHGVYEATLRNGHPCVQPVTIKIKITNGDTFSDLNKTICNSTSNKITLDRNYAFNSTVDSEFIHGIPINREVTIKGNGCTIDANGFARIFDIEASNVTIENITFRNAENNMGGAILINGYYASISNCTFTNNIATFGGAIRCMGWYANISDCIFTNNNASQYGGAIEFHEIYNNTISNCVFVGNDADEDGGAIYGLHCDGSISNCTFIANNAIHGGAVFFDWAVSATVINCNFEGNTAINGSAIYWKHSDGLIYRSTFINNTAMFGGAAIYLNGNITNIASCLFINNTADYGIVYYECFYKGFTFNSNIMLDGAERGEIFFSDEDKSANIDFNWFGNNATNCQVGPACNQVPDVWLFLDASADPLTLPAFGSSDITFNLYTYESLDPFICSVYDASLLMPVNLTVSSTNGHANDTAVPLGKSVRYTAEGTGKGSLTAALEYANFTVELNIKENPDLSVESQTITYGSNATLALSYNSSATGRLNITLNSKKFNYTFKDIALNATVSLGKLNPDEYNITVTYSGDETFSNSTAKAALTVDPIVDLAANITADKEAYLIGDLAIWTVTVTSAGNGSNATDVLLDMWFPFQYFEYVIYDVDRGSFDAESMEWDIGFMENGTNATLHITGLANVSKKQITNRVTVACNESDWNILNNFAYSYVDVEKLNSTVDVNDTEVEYGNVTNITVKTEGAKGIAAKINGTNATVVGFTIEIPIMDVGIYNLTVTTIPDENHESVNKTVKIIVNKAPAEIIIANSTLDVKVLNFTFTGASLNPDEAGYLTYHSSNSSVAIVWGGVIMPVGKGQAIITVSFNGNHNYEAAESRNITVNVDLNDASVSVNNNTLDLLVDDTFNLVATTEPKDLTVNFTSSNSSVVTVDNGGNVVAVGEGTATINVSVGGDGIYVKNSTTVTVTVSKVSTEISIENDTLVLAVSDEIATGATLTPPDAGNLTYSISNSSVVKVEDGKIIALVEGESTITVSFEGSNKYFEAENKTINVTVNLHDARVSVNNNTLDLLVDDTFNLVAATEPKDLTVNFTSSSPSVVTVDKNGNVMAVSEGTATINVSVGGDGIYVKNSTTVMVTVSKVPTEITVDSVSLDLFVGDEKVIVASLAPGDAGNVTFTSSNESVVIVDAKGNVIANDKGQANITVSFAGDDKYAASQNKTINVDVSLCDASVTVDKDTLDLKVGETYAINATKHPDTILLEITYKSSDDSVATVDEKGIVTAVGVGTAIITLSVGDEEIYAENSTNITVTVKKATPKITAKAKTFKDTDKNKKYAVTLKDSKGNPIKNTSVRLKVNGRTYTATTNKNGVATFYLKKLTKTGKYTATITYPGNNKYNKVTKKAKITVKQTWKTISKGSKNHAMVKKIQKALKKNGYYLTYKGRYLKVDGIFHDCTLRAVKEFQKAKGLKVTGKVDYKTAKKLKLVK